MAETQKFIEKAINIDPHMNNLLLIDHKLRYVTTALGEWKKIRKIMPILPFCDDAHFFIFAIYMTYHMTIYGWL